MTLQVQNTSYSYRRGGEVLHSISETFDVGATVLLGANGAGKSTLLDILASVRIPGTGTVLLDGVALAPTNGDKLRRYRAAVAWLPQSLRLFPALTVREHVAYAGWLKGMPKHLAWERSLAALDRVDLQAKADQNTKRLSGGQQQRVALAGAIVHDAKVVLLDEPTAGLDPAQRRQFRELLADLASTRIALVSSHDTDDAHSTFDHVAVLRDGRMTFHGRFDEFVESTPAGGDMRDRVEAAYMVWAGSPE